MRVIFYNKAFVAEIYYWFKKKNTKSDGLYKMIMTNVIYPLNVTRIKRGESIIQRSSYRHLRTLKRVKFLCWISDIGN